MSCSAITLNLILLSILVLIGSKGTLAFAPAKSCKLRWNLPDTINGVSSRCNNIVIPSHFPQNTVLNLAADESSGGAKKSNLPMVLDPGTNGGVLFYSSLLIVVPFTGYVISTNFFGLDSIELGKWIGIVFSALLMVIWVSTYIFRVATKDMTYAKQLKDYENAVIAKRLEELDEDEVQALVEDIERDF